MPSQNPRFHTILQIHNVQSARGGADMVIEREADLLTERGHRIIPMLVETTKALEQSRIRAAMKAFWNVSACADATRLIQEHRPEIVHVHTPFPVLSPAIFRAARRMKVPTVVTLHSHRMICVNALFQRNGVPCELCVGHRIPWPAIQHRCYHNSLAGSAVMAGTLAFHHLAGTFSHCIDRYVALSQFAKDRLVRTGFPESKICVRPNFVPRSESPGDGSAGNVLFVGRLVPEKGIQTVIHAWKLLPDAPRLTVIGDGPMRSALTEDARGLNVEFTGWQSPSTVAELMGNAALTIFPSEIFEAGPLVLIESYSRGTPVLASDIGNFSDQVIEGQTGGLFRTADPTDLAAKVAALFRTPETLSKMRTNAFDEYNRLYTPDASYDSLMQIYAAAADRGSQT